LGATAKKYTQTQASLSTSLKINQKLIFPLTNQDKSGTIVTMRHCAKTKNNTGGTTYEDE
jgi:hypothetical protein